MKGRTLGIILVLITLLLAVAYVATSWYFSSILLSSPTETLAEAAADEETPADFGLPEPELIVIDAGDVTLSGWLFENPAEGNCGLLFLHGFRGTRYHVLNWAPMFWSRGCDILAYDHRGHGDSTPAFHTFGFHEKLDAIAALDWFAAQTGLDRSDIGVFGVSYGAATALQMAPLTPDIAFIGADSAYSEMEEIVDYQARRLFPTLAPLILPGALAVSELRADFDVQAVAPERSIADAQVPILLIHSLTDEYTFASHSEDIYASSDHLQTVLHLNDWGAPHGRDVLTNPAGYWRLVDEFLAQFAPDFGLPPTP